MASDEQHSEHVKARLIPETTTAVAGSTLWLALRLEHAEHWHTYWINPGDAGKADPAAIHPLAWADDPPGGAARLYWVPATGVEAAAAGYREECCRQRGQGPPPP